MSTLGSWDRKLLVVPSTIECPEMQLISADDNEPPVFTGPGHIDIRSSTAIDFTMFATPADSADAWRRIRQARENPYEISEQFRLNATDYQGAEWECGWTQPTLKGMPKIGWPLRGNLNSLVTEASGPSVSTESSVELVFHPKFWLPMDKTMITVATVDGVEIEQHYTAGQQTVHVLGSEIKFFYTPSGESLWATAKTSDKLSHPYAENWLSEPLRVLLGQLICPRLVARNFGNGTAHIWLRPSPRGPRNSGIASLIRGNALSKGPEFWSLYSNLLTLIAEARDEVGYPNFEAHQITQFYEEIIQATRGSRWILCMTLASSAEGLVLMLVPPGKKVKVDNFLKTLVGQGLLTEENQRSWTTVRHAVMHGKLTSPWATKEEDSRILELADLVHRLTHILIREKVKVEGDSVKTSNGTAPDAAGPAASGEHGPEGEGQE
jgi:hypothetical protein